jgi:hypothetical protein
VIEGILDPADAMRAVEHGAAASWIERRPAWMPSKGS